MDLTIGAVWVLTIVKIIGRGFPFNKLMRYRHSIAPVTGKTKVRTVSVLCKRPETKIHAKHNSVSGNKSLVPL